MEKSTQTTQTNFENFEQKAEELVSLLLLLAEEHAAAVPSGSPGMTAVTFSALSIKYSLDTFMTIMKKE